MKKKVIKKKEDDYDVREVYLENRAAMLEDFASCLEEVQRDEPSVGGKIAGMDFQQFRAVSVFRLIREQEEYAANESNAEYVDAAEEKKILADMVKRAKKVFGKDYKKWYDNSAD